MGMLLSLADVHHFSTADVDIIKCTGSCVFPLGVELVKASIMLSFFFSQEDRVFSGTQKSLAMRAFLAFLYGQGSPIVCLYTFTFNFCFTPLLPNADFALGAVISDLLFPQFGQILHQIASCKMSTNYQSSYPPGLTGSFTRLLHITIQFFRESCCAIVAILVL